MRHTTRPEISRATGSRPRLWLTLVVALVGLLAFAGSAAAATVTEFSAGITPGSRPEGIAAGPDGNLWFTERDGDRIGRITPAGVVTEFSAGITANSGPNGITAGPDGNLWFTELFSGRVGRITPAGVVNEFVVTAAAPANDLQGITAGPGGNLWYTVGSRIGRITTAGTPLAEFSAGITSGSDLQQITAGPDGNVWFTENGGSRVGRITPAGTVTEFPTGLGQNVSSDIVTGPDRNLWFTAGNVGGRIGRITPAGAVTPFRAGSSGTLPGIAAGPDGNLWFAEGANRIGRITPGGVVNEFSAGITSGSSPNGIAAGPDRNLWFTESLGNRIGRITTDVTVTPPVLTLPKPVLGKFVNAQVVRGRVLVSVPVAKARASASVPGLKGRVFVPLVGAKQIPVGSLLDTRTGTVKLTSARNTAGATQSANFQSGVFQVRQSPKRSAKGLTDLRLKGSSFRTCTSRVRSRRRGRFKTPGRVRTPTVRGGRAAAARRSRRTIRRLRGNGSGRFRTRGRYSAATVRGTDWTIFDRCDGTLTKVKRGTVAVRDFRRKRTVKVRAGKSYLARPRR